MDEGGVRQFAKESTDTFKNSELNFQAVFFNDKIIINVIIDGVADATFDIPLSTKSAISSSLNLDESLPVEPVVLVGDPQNVKMQVIASQIGKVVLHLKQPKSVILSIGTRWFGRGDETNEDDFEKLALILQHIKALLQ